MQLYSTRQLLGSFPSFELLSLMSPFFGKKSIPVKQHVAPEQFVKVHEISDISWQTQIEFPAFRLVTLVLGWSRNDLRESVTWQP